MNAILELLHSPASFLLNITIQRGIDAGPREIEEYAEECRRLAKTLKPEHKEALLKIAAAWEECADEAEERAKRSHTE